jgi:hypothetical protein
VDSRPPAPMLEHGSEKCPMLEHGSEKCPMLEHGSEKCPMRKHGSEKCPMRKHGARMRPAAMLPHGSFLALLLITLLLPSPTHASPINHAGFDYYYGDLHAHTGLSLDGYSTDLGGGCPAGYECGPSSTVIADARETWDLDFLSLTEHGNGMHAVWDSSRWDQQRLDLLDADDPAGGFVTIPGVELWLWEADGNIRDHRNLYLFGDASDLEEFSLSDLVGDPDAPPFTTDECLAIFDLLGEFEEDLGPVMLINHHPAVRPPAAADWTCVDLAFGPVVENYSEHGNSQSPSYEGYYDPVDPDAEQPESTVDHALSPDGHGLRMGIIGGTDSHDTRPGSICDIDPRFQHNAVNYGGGLTVVVLPEGTPFDRMAIHDALAARRGQSTSGPRVPVDFRATAGGVTLAAMGEEVTAAPGTDVTFVAAVHDSDAGAVLGATLIRPEYSRTPMEELVPGSYSVTLTLDAADTVVAYVVVDVDGTAWWGDVGLECDDSGSSELEQIWSSPIWIDVDVGDDDDTSNPDDDDSGNPGDDDCSCNNVSDGSSVISDVSVVVTLVLLAAARRGRKQNEGE